MSGGGIGRLRRQDAARDLLLTARSVSEVAERAAWDLLGAGGTPTSYDSLEELRRAALDAAAGLSAEARALYAPTPQAHTIITEARRAGPSLCGASLSDDEQRRVLALLVAWPVVPTDDEIAAMRAR